MRENNFKYVENLTEAERNILSRFSMGIVFRGPLDALADAVNHIQNNPDIQIIFIRREPNRKLFITLDDPKQSRHRQPGSDWR